MIIENTTNFLDGCFAGQSVYLFLWKSASSLTSCVVYLTLILQLEEMVSKLREKSEGGRQRQQVYLHSEYYISPTTFSQKVFIYLWQ